ncbi:MAG: hypothetical protein M3680_20475 [Myxococcota bacterium]|nr:hypothetical protein [Myxococcota bacterium]
MCARWFPTVVAIALTIAGLVREPALGRAGPVGPLAEIGETDALARGSVGTARRAHAVRSVAHAAGIELGDALVLVTDAVIADLTCTTHPGLAPVPWDPAPRSIAIRAARAPPRT